MKIGDFVLCFGAFCLTQSPSAAQSSQVSHGKCSPNIANVAGNVSIQFTGTACADLDPDAVRKVNQFLFAYSKSQLRLQNLVDTNLTVLFDTSPDNRLTAALVISIVGGSGKSTALRLQEAVHREIDEVARLKSVQDDAGRGIGWGGMDNGSLKALREAGQNLLKSYQIITFESEALAEMRSSANEQLSDLRGVADTIGDPQVAGAIDRGLTAISTKAKVR
jgi:hypothetical protein